MGLWLNFYYKICLLDDNAHSETTRPHPGCHQRMTTGARSRSFALGLLSRGRQHAQSQQINIRPAKHLPLEHLQPVELPLHRPRTPRKAHPRLPRGIVVAEAGGPPCKRLHGTPGGTLEPAIELRGLPLAHQRGKVLTQPDGLGYLALLAL